MTPVRVVGAALVREGKMLAVRRPLHKRQGGRWELPGGKVEPGETDAVALARELVEELEIEAEVHELGGDYLHRYDEGAIHLYAYRCTSPDAVTLVEHIDERWLAADELLTIDWADADRAIIEGAIQTVRDWLGGAEG